MALRKYYSLASLKRLYRVRRGDFVLSASALVGVLLFGVLPGVIIGVVRSKIRWNGQCACVSQNNHGDNNAPSRMTASA